MNSSICVGDAAIRTVAQHGDDLSASTNFNEIQFKLIKKTMCLNASFKTILSLNFI